MSFDKIRRARKHDAYTNELTAWRQSIPQSLRGFDMDTLLDTNWNGKLSKMSVRSVREYINDPSMFLLLHGASGLGKTVMGVLIIDRFMTTGKVSSGLYIDTPTLLYDVSYGDKRQSNMIHVLSRPDILLIDDIGAGGSEKLTDIRKDALWRIINYRWMHEKYTIMTTNLPIMNLNDNEKTTTIQSWFGQASWDRIAHDVTAINFQGQSMRRKTHR